MHKYCVDNHYPTCSKLIYRLPASLHCMALLCIQLDYVVIFTGPFFFCLVCGLLEKKLIRLNLACRRAPGTMRSVCMFVDADFIASRWAWLYGPMHSHCGIRSGCSNRWMCPGFGVTFEPRMVHHTIQYYTIQRFTPVLTGM